jgi:anaerobic ribonucleoside-triphosphate reductase activating protein
VVVTGGAHRDERVMLSRLHHPVLALGPGRRAGIWFQGCSIRCHGCSSMDTWRVDETTSVPVAQVIAWIESLGADIEGVTITGGEPTEQPAALRAVLDGIACLNAARADDAPPLDTLVFTGREPEWASGPGREVLAGADAVVAGPYVDAEAGDTPLRGSENQRLLALTPLGATRFATERLPGRDMMQLAISDGEVWMIGIPRPGVLNRLDEAVTRAGIHLRGRSWSR